ncbi:unnamed protein product [Vitrella brassicaformis CCMP3155]|uniref:Uncharacterized protein n=1 Tax=Vitrella brassicaformis (strain CCMP3155) TaxID=1169540 RepID=A0A0G4EBR8_VITBC|nr:unnamed protein product [Vitrella brassicaformis CCMP3155]|mmetsp:Transcript_15714/g.44864  ORF Transcript_15714/g.44864 Transcript_15714/m.44864 type:complete len:392 (-) Transcript_15714:191-1366(-)|eukprot:CEL92742.1 unnamed protein product [Vitrella brassicaformis CCMP3155]
MSPLYSSTQQLRSGACVVLAAAMLTSFIHASKMPSAAAPTVSRSSRGTKLACLPGGTQAGSAAKVVLGLFGRQPSSAAAALSALQVCSAGASFCLTVTASQHLQRSINVSTRLPLIASLAGLLTAAAAAASASLSAQMVQSLMASRQPLLHVLCNTQWTFVRRDVMIGLSLFLLMGGRLQSLCPSSLLSPGVYAQPGGLGSLPATMEYASPRERSVIQRLGRIYGCHTCGTRRGPFNADHQPPRSVVRQRIRSMGESPADRRLRTAAVRPSTTPMATPLPPRTFPEPSAPPMPSEPEAEPEPPTKVPKRRRSFVVRRASPWQWLSGRRLRQRFYPQCEACSERQARACAADDPYGRAYLVVPGGLKALRRHHLAGAALVWIRLLVEVYSHT